MLTELHVVNLGIIADLTVPLGAGLTAITGETGAGKTLLVEALSLLLGGRADPALVREGATEARVEGRFVLGADETVLARVIPAEGRSRAYVDGRLATVAEVTALGRTLVDLHGQHDQQSLLAPAAQRALLDAFAGTPAADARAELRSARAEVAQLRRDLAELGGDEQARAREVDLLRFQLDEIDRAGVSDPTEDDRLAALEERLADADGYRHALGDAYGSLGAATDTLGAAVSVLGAHGGFAAIAERARALQAEAADLASEVRRERDEVVADPAELDRVRTRRLALRELRRKYGPGLGDVVAFAADARDRLEALVTRDERAVALEAAITASEARAVATAGRLSALRRAAAPDLAAAVGAQVRTLALPRATFAVHIEAAELGDDGADLVEFRFSANQGEPERSLAKVASGGELSRVMLAVRVVLSEAPPTLVFDEVDAGIGGEAGFAVGRALAHLGGSHQVLCVTHLPQVAAFADGQLSVRKTEADGRTQAAADLLLPDARVGELSRMLSGLGASEHARSHAQELLDLARQARSEPLGMPTAPATPARKAKPKQTKATRSR